MIYLRSQILRTVVKKDFASGTFYREATRTYGLQTLGLDDIQDDPSINRGGVVLITSLSEFRTFVWTFFLISTAARIFTGFLCCYAAYRSEATNFLWIVMAVCSGIGFAVLNVLMPPFSVPHGYVVDRFGNYIHLQTGDSNLNGGCTVR